MSKIVFSLLLLFTVSVMVAQEDDSPDEPIIPINKAGLLKNIDITFDMRMDFQAYTLRPTNAPGAVTKTSAAAFCISGR